MSKDTYTIGPDDFPAAIISVEYLIEPGEGYRFLCDGETIFGDDEHYDPFDKQWIRVTREYQEYSIFTDGLYRRKDEPDIDWDAEDKEWDAARKAKAESNLGPFDEHPKY